MLFRSRAVSVKHPRLVYSGLIQAYVMKKNVCFYRVIYGDTDQMGVVYYANYLRWFEMGRTELLRQLGAPYSSIEGRGAFFPVTEVSSGLLRHEACAYG